MTRLSVRRYDLFKLLVTVVLIIILILLFLREGATTPAATLPSGNASLATSTQSLASIAPTQATIATRAAEILSASPAPSATLAAQSTATRVTAATSPISASTPTESPANLASTAAPAVGQSTSCNTRLPSRLSIGQQARVAQRLNLRTAPSIDAPVLQTNSVDTTVEIIGGPACTPAGERAYLWWQVRLADGAEGWSAETQLNEPAYLLQPIP